MKLMDLQTIRQNLVESKNNKNVFSSGKTLGFKKDLPIEPKSSDWISKDSCLCKTFYFSNAKNTKHFFEKMYIIMERFFHHSKFSVEEYSVEVALTTKILNDISSQDIEISKMLDDIYFDIESNQ